MNASLRGDVTLNDLGVTVRHSEAVNGTGFPPRVVS